MKKTFDSAYGFTLIELLVVMAIIAIVGTIIIIYISPQINFGKAHNAKRANDINEISNAIYYYTTDNSGQEFPPQIPEADTCSADMSHQICKTDGNCDGLVDLSVLTHNQRYFVTIPTDPTNAKENGTGYYVSRNSNNRILICAPYAENGQTISIIR